MRKLGLLCLMFFSLAAQQQVDKKPAEDQDQVESILPTQAELQPINVVADILKAPGTEKLPLIAHYGDVSVRLGGKLRMENFFAKNVGLLNNNNSDKLRLDLVYYSQHTLDLNMDLLYGQNKFGYNAIEFYFNIRNKGRWGHPESLAPTSDATVKLQDVVTGRHRHFLGKHIFWIREIWFKFCLNSLTDIGLENKHHMTIGAFPFQLGRGIALGSAFAVSPGLLGFYSSNVIDQFAFG